MNYSDKPFFDKEQLQQIERLKRCTECFELMETAGVVNHEYFCDLYDDVLNGRETRSIKAAQKIKKELTGTLLYLETVEKINPGFQDVPKHKWIFTGIDVATNQPVIIDLDDLVQHLLIAGMTGVGKTTFEWNLIQQLLQMGVSITMQDYQNEGRRAVDIFPDLLVLPLDKLPVNFLEPVGNPETYFSHFFNELVDLDVLMPPTAMRLVDFILNLVAGMQPGDDYPSLQDFTYLLHNEAKKF